MRKQILVLAACAVLFVGCGGGGGGSSTPPPPTPPTSSAVTYHYFTGTSASAAVGLFSVSSTSPSTPATVNSNSLAQRSTVWTGTVDMATGVVSNSRTYAVVFSANGRLWKQYADRAPAPVQLSNVTSISSGLGNATDLCYMNTVPDFGVPENSVVIYGQAGANNTCGDADDVYSWTRLGTNTSTAPTVLTNLPVAPVYNNAGAITNFLVINSATGALEKRDANFSSISATISAGPFPVTSNDKAIWLQHLSPTRILLHLPPPCSSLPCSIGGELRIVDASDNLITGNTITGVLGTTANRALWFFNYINGPFNVYFVGNDAAGTPVGTIQMFPIDGSAAATTFHNGGAVSITSLYLTTNSVVYESNDGAGSFAISSVPKTNGATKLTLASSAVVGERLWLDGVSNTGYVYFDRFPATFSANRAEAVRDDNSGHVVFGTPNGAEWSGLNFPTTWNYFNTYSFLDKLVVAEYAPLATDSAGATLSVVDAGTAAKNGIVVGTVPAGIQFLNGFSEGTRGLWMANDGDFEIFYVDTVIAGSLTRVTNDSVFQQPVY